MASISKITTPDGNSYDLKAKFDIDGNEIKTSYIKTSQKGAASGVAELDSSGKVPTSQLPSYVDDVLEYENKSSFPATGETGKIYVDKATNLTYRWSGTAYVEISPSLALGTTSSTAFRGDYGNTAYIHATDSSRLTTAQTSGLYKIAVSSEGHVSSADAVTKSDITGLGIPGSVPTDVSEFNNDAGYQNSTQVNAAIGAEAGKLVPYGYCETAAATVAKTVTVSPAVTELTTGLIIAVKFEYANTGTNPTLNVNGLGAKAIKRYGTTAAGTSSASNWNANAVMMLTYDGTYWMLNDWVNTTYSGMTDAEYQAGTSTTNKLITPARLKAAIEYHAPVTSVNGEIGDVTIDVPTKTSDLTNDSGFITNADVPTKTSDLTNDSGFITSADVPTNTSDLTNDSGFITIASVPTKTSDLTNDSGFITSANVPNPASESPIMDGTAAVGTSAKYAREDHVHPSDTSRVPTTRKVNGHALSSDVTITASDVGAVPTTRTVNGKALSADISLTASDVSAIATSQKGVASGVAELDSSGKVPSSQLPSYVDDVLEYANKASFPTTGETGKIYVDKATNLTYRWSGTAYVEISPSLALGETSSTAYRGDYGAAAYAHAVTNKGSAFTSGLYKITTNSEGHVTAATAVQKSDITGLGIPGSDTNTTYTFTDGTNGFTVTPSDGSAQTVNVTPSMTILSYGSSTWADFLAAYQANSIVYCRASSNSNPATGSQTRMAFMAYVNNATTPTEVEFQYYRSVSTHSDSQQGDQVYVYKLTNKGAWTVTVRNTFTKVASSTGLSSTWSSGTWTAKANLVSDTALTNAASAATEVANRVYPVAVDKNGKLAVNVPWEGSQLDPATATPSMDGTGAVGTSTKYAREDHVHPSDTTKVDKETGKGLSTNDYSNSEMSNVLSAYTHAVTNKGSAFTSGLYKITTNSEGHVTAATVVQKSDITGLGIPGSDTTYSLVGAQNTTGLVKNGSGVSDVTLYNPCPIVQGIPYYKNEDVAIYDGDGNEIATTYWKKSDTIQYDYDSTNEALYLLNDFDGYGYSDLTGSLTI